MKRWFFISIMLLLASVSYAQRDSIFYKHEAKLAVGDALVYSLMMNERFYNNVSVAYFYRPVKWFWVGGNVINYFGNIIHYNWREYNTDGNYRDFSKSKMKHIVVLAPEMRFSYLNKEKVILYSSFSIGVGWVNGYDYKITDKYPQKVSYFQTTLLGFSINFGKNDNIFLGGELGNAFKGLLNFHGGYRF